MSIRFVALVWLVLAACTDSGPTRTLRVLFIGNSLTSANDLPRTVARLSAMDGNDLRIEVRDMSLPDHSLEDQWGTIETMEALEQEQWDMVVLQQGPSSLPANQQHLATWATQWAGLIRERGALPALYMVWPEESRLDAFDDVSQSYRAAAEDADASLYPAGEAWRAAWRANPSLALYGPDGFHPSPMGSYLAALTIYHGITGRRVVGLPSEEWPEDVARTLQQAAEEATAQFGR